jgi:Ni/Co efflux regulator RcnB
MASFFSIRTALALLTAAAFTVAPAFAQPGGEGHGKGRDKAEKQADKAEKKAEKQAGKADKHAEKAERKADKQWAKAEDKLEKSERYAPAKGAHRDSNDIRVGAFFNDDHRGRVRSYYVQHYGGPKGCPPGLAKKNNGCLPPGQAKKYTVGQPLPAGVVVYTVPQPVYTYLPAVPVGYRYVRIGNDIVLLSPQTGLVVDVIVNLLG